MKGIIRIVGARQHNLKNIDLEINLGELTVITGVSGSGKSSLALSTLYAEGQRRYVESFSPYIRQFLGREDRPDVDRIEGILPAIAIERVNRILSSRSTVGTVAELEDYLKLLFHHLSVLHCGSCGAPVRPTTAEDLHRWWRTQATGPWLVAFPFTAGEPAARREFLLSAGLVRCLAGDDVIRLEDLPEGEPPDLVIMDRLPETCEPERFTDAVDQSYRLGDDRLVLIGPDGDRHAFRRGLVCPNCDITYGDSSPNLFSFNSPAGACPECEGFGAVLRIDEHKVVPDPRLSIAAGAIKPWTTATARPTFEELLNYCTAAGIPTDVPYERLPAQARHAVFHGDHRWFGVVGFFNWLEQYRYKMHVRVFLSRYRSQFTCPVCKGSRMRPEAILYRLQGKPINELRGMSLDDLEAFITGLTVVDRDQAAAVVRDELITRLGYLREIGLGYLTLERPSRTLSGGEVQRVNLTTALGTALTNTLFVLDEPSAGLHARDIGRLNAILRRLRAAGNTVVVVEHDPAVIRAADRVIDLGPGAGEKGGEIVFQGTPAQLAGATTVTGRHFRGDEAETTRRHQRRTWGAISLRNASMHNLQHLDVTFPLGSLVCITGVSGSGKSTLVEDLLYPAVQYRLGERFAAPPAMDGIEIHGKLEAVRLIDGAPPSTNSRATPASILKLLDPIRKRFAATAGARKRGFSASHFSFNSPAGRCPTCNGQGYEIIEMQFLADVMIRCPECKGRRFRDEILEVRKDGLSIADVLELTACEAREKFAGARDLVDRLDLMIRLGLGYLQLGQPLGALSAGETQRLKLALHLQQGGIRRTLYLLDEPTTGLHPADITMLVNALDHLLDAGNAVIVIEHNLDFIRFADYLVDLGPEGGAAGGRIVFEGPLENAFTAQGSLTAAALRGEIGLTEAPEPARVDATDEMVIRGAREHNLKNIDLRLPHGKMIVITGLSGSGKSTLAHDILFAEGQRRYIESLSTYARRFIRQLRRPVVDAILGLPPAVAIEQRLARGSARSTVGTISEVMDFLRLLFARTGTQHCERCGEKLTPLSIEEMAETIVRRPDREEVSLVAPAVVGRKGYHKEAMRSMAAQGCTRIFADGRFYPATSLPELERYGIHDVGGETARFIPGTMDRRVMIRELRRCLDLGDDHLWVIPATGERMEMTTAEHCLRCGIGYPPLEPRSFSFNAAAGRCPSCDGLGTTPNVMEDLALPRSAPSLEEGGCPPLQLKTFPRAIRRGVLKEAARLGIDSTRPIASWPPAWRSLFLSGIAGKTSQDAGFEGLAAILLRLAADGYRNQAVGGLDEFIERTACPDCGGLRLNARALAVQAAGHTVRELLGMSIDEALEFWSMVQLTGREARLARDIIPEITARLSFMREVGLGYLTLARGMDTLSGGEIQRTRLSAQLSSDLRGVLYVLDEPTIGLHRRDHLRLLNTLGRLAAQGNSVVIVEHDEATIRHADLVVDLGPGGGSGGGRVVAVGTPEQVMHTAESITGACLRTPPVPPPVCHEAPDRWLEIHGAHAHNLQHIDVRIPLQRLTAITGVSGSGKSSLLLDVLNRNIPGLIRGDRSTPQHATGITGYKQLDRLLLVDQSPIGRTPRSNPATYVGCFDAIRKVFANLPQSRIRGYSASHFSFNVKGGRCDACEGQGKIKIEMRFLPDVYIPCETCNGARYRKEILDARRRGRSIADVLAMTIEEALDFFAEHARIAGPLQVLTDIGLGYLQVGQESNTLSGGEAQRVKLAAELGGRSSAHTLFLLDEPTTGLHMADVRRLLGVLRTLVNRGNTVVVVEHDLDFIAGCDHLIDLGPEAARQGGRIVAEGCLKDLLDSTVESHTLGVIRDHRATVRERP
ncbi:excinuclease ABC subunit UvrA [bacterium]|nr:excinuclease ABC subunit UvrA [candidate division CSSED10-310 bacterium]